LWEVARSEQKSDGALTQALLDHFNVGEVKDLVQTQEAQSVLNAWGFKSEDLLYTPDPERPDLKMLHPLFTAAIIEALQFDGDIPELRHGELPEGGFAAVPVHSEARDPVTLGAMLEIASERTTTALRKAREKKDEKIAKIVSGLGATEELVALSQQELERGVSVSGYQPGSPAKVQTVESPNQITLAKLSPEAKQALSYKALTSSQGRKSATPVITDVIQRRVSQEGVTVIMGAVDPKSATKFEWSMSIDHSRHEQNPKFNFIDTAANALSAKIIQHIRNNQLKGVHLWVTPISEVSKRRVGWEAWLK
jgi:hypothetical protein